MRLLLFFCIWPVLDCRRLQLSTVAATSCKRKVHWDPLTESVPVSCCTSVSMACHSYVAEQSPQLLMSPTSDSQSLIDNAMQSNRDSWETVAPKHAQHDHFTTPPNSSADVQQQGSEGSRTWSCRAANVVKILSPVQQPSASSSSNNPLLQHPELPPFPTTSAQTAPQGTLPSSSSGLRPGFVNSSTCRPHQILRQLELLIRDSALDLYLIFSVMLMRRCFQV